VTTFPEEIVPFTGEHDWEQVVRDIMKMEPQQLELEEKQIVRKFNFPNTYTFSKNLAEQAILKFKKPNLKVTITRPASVSAC